MDINIVKSACWIYTLMYVSGGIWASRRLRRKLWWASTKDVYNAWGQGWWCALPCHRVQQASAHQGRPRVPTTTRLSATKYSSTALSRSQQHCLHCPLLLSHSVCRKRLTLFIAVTAVYFCITSAEKMKQSKNARKTIRQLRERRYLVFTIWSIPDQHKNTHKIDFNRFSHLCSKYLLSVIFSPVNMSRFLHLSYLCCNVSWSLDDSLPFHIGFSSNRSIKQHSRFSPNPSQSFRTFLLSVSRKIDPQPHPRTQESGTQTGPSGWFIGRIHCQPHWGMTGSTHRFWHPWSLQQLQKGKENGWNQRGCIIELYVTLKLWWENW